MHSIGNYSSSSSAEGATWYLGGRRHDLGTIISIIKKKFSSFCFVLFKNSVQVCYHNV